MKCTLSPVTRHPSPAEKTCRCYLVVAPKLFGASRGPVFNRQNTRHVIFKHMHGIQVNCLKKGDLTNLGQLGFNSISVT